MSPRPPDIDIFRAAKLILEQHGHAADFYAAERADKLLEEGDLEGAEVWRRIFRAVRSLIDPPGAGDQVH